MHKKKGLKLFLVLLGCLVFSSTLVLSNEGSGLFDVLDMEPQEIEGQLLPSCDENHLIIYKDGWQCITAPPICVGSNKGLQWDGSEWNCKTFGTQSSNENGFYSNNGKIYPIDLIDSLPGIPSADGYRIKYDAPGDGLEPYYPDTEYGNGWVHADDLNCEMVMIPSGEVKVWITPANENGGDWSAGEEIGPETINVADQAGNFDTDFKFKENVKSNKGAIVPDEMFEKKVMANGYQLMFDSLEDEMDAYKPDTDYGEGWMYLEEFESETVNIPSGEVEVSIRPAMDEDNYEGVVSSSVVNVDDVTETFGTEFKFKENVQSENGEIYPDELFEQKQMAKGYQLAFDSLEDSEGEYNPETEYGDGWVYLEDFSSEKVKIPFGEVKVWVRPAMDEENTGEWSGPATINVEDKEGTFNADFELNTEITSNNGEIFPEALFKQKEMADGYRVAFNSLADSLDFYTPETNYGDGWVHADDLNSEKIMIPSGGVEVYVMPAYENNGEWSQGDWKGPFKTLVEDSSGSFGTEFKFKNNIQSDKGMIVANNLFEQKLLAKGYQFEFDSTQDQMDAYLPITNYGEGWLYQDELDSKKLRIPSGEVKVKVRPGIDESNYGEWTDYVTINVEDKTGTFATDFKFKTQAKAVNNLIKPIDLFEEIQMANWYKFTFVPPFGGATWEEYTPETEEGDGLVHVDDFESEQLDIPTGDVKVKIQPAMDEDNTGEVSEASVKITN